MNSKKNEYKSHIGGDTTQDAPDNTEPEIPKPIFDNLMAEWFQILYSTKFVHEYIAILFLQRLL